MGDPYDAASTHGVQTTNQGLPNGGIAPPVTSPASPSFPHNITANWFSNVAKKMEGLFFRSTSTSEYFFTPSQGNPATATTTGQSLGVKSGQETYGSKGTDLTQQAANTREKTSKTVYEHFKALIARFLGPKTPDMVKNQTAHAAPKESSKTSGASKPASGAPKVDKAAQEREQKAMAQLDDLLKMSESELKGLSPDQLKDISAVVHTDSLISKFAALIDGPANMPKAAIILQKLVSENFPADKLLKGIASNTQKLGFMKQISGIEIQKQKSPDTFLRGNTVTTRLITAFTNEKCAPFTGALKGVITSHLSEKFALKRKDHESKDEKVIAAGIHAAERQLGAAIPGILEELNAELSKAQIPEDLKAFHQFMYDAIKEQFGEDQAKILAPQGFILRYLNPLFTAAGLDANDPQKMATATALAKACQFLANRVTESQKEGKGAVEYFNDNPQSYQPLDKIWDAVH